MTFHLLDQKHFLLLASGVELGDNSIGNHFGSVAFTNIAVNLTIPANIEAGQRVLVMVHGSLMVVAWIGTASIGIFFARHFKETWKSHKICGSQDVWFVWHFVSMLLTFVLTTSSFIIIFVDVGAWRTSVHAVTGTIVMVLTFLQPFAASFRPKPTHPKRPIFNFLHFSAGNIIHVLAIITIFYAVPMLPASLPEWTTYVLVAFSVFYLLMHVTMTVRIKFCNVFLMSRYVNNCSFQTIRICGEVKRKTKLGSTKNPPVRFIII